MAPIIIVGVALGAYLLISSLMSPPSSNPLPPGYPPGGLLPPGYVPGTTPPPTYGVPPPNPNTTPPGSPLPGTTLPGTNIPLPGPFGNIKIDLPTSAITPTTTGMSPAAAAATAANAAIVAHNLAQDAAWASLAPDAQMLAKAQELETELNATTTANGKPTLRKRYLDAVAAIAAGRTPADAKTQFELPTNMVPPKPYGSMGVIAFQGHFNRIQPATPIGLGFGLGNYDAATASALSRVLGRPTPPV